MHENTPPVPEPHGAPFNHGPSQRRLPEETRTAGSPPHTAPPGPHATCSQAAVDEEDHDDDDDASQAAKRQSTQEPGAPPPISDVERDRLAGNLGRYLLFHEHTKHGVTRADLKKAILGDHQDKTGKIFKYVLDRAQVKLQEVFGLDIQTLGAAKATDDQTQTTASGRYVLVNQLSHGDDELGFQPDEEHQKYMGMVLVAVEIVRRYDDECPEDKLHGLLESLGLPSEASKDADGSTEDGAKCRLPSVLDVCKRMVREFYLCPCMYVYAATVGRRARASICPPLSPSLAPSQLLQWWQGLPGRPSHATGDQRQALGATAAQDRRWSQGERGQV